MKGLLMLAALLCAASGRAQTSEYEPVLLPISLLKPVPGAYGSLWSTEFWVTASSGDVRFLQTGDCLACPPSIVVPANRSLSFESGGGFPGQPSGAVLHLQRSTGANAAFNLRVRDLSQQALTWGTELPIVRESEYRTSSLVLTNIPLDTRFRQALRIYDPDAHINAQFTVRIQEASSGQLLAERMLFAQAGTLAGTYPIIPSVAEVAFLSASFPELPAAGRARVTIIPGGNVTRFWAFVSITNNDTQHVTTITPQ